MINFEEYGKNVIKKHKTSPDAWAQLVKQLAFYRHTGRPGVTYESCQTRKFALGRTEVIRSCSQESTDWVKSMLDASKTDGEREKLFRRAVARHIQYSSWAADGQGVDRHMFGLKRLVDANKGEEMPAVFKDEVHARSSHWEMSTSQLSSRWLDGWGYGEGECGTWPLGFSHLYSFLGAGKAEGERGLSAMRREGVRVGTSNATVPSGCITLIFCLWPITWMYQASLIAQWLRMGTVCRTLSKMTI